jgi:hypothetical protein
MNDDDIRALYASFASALQPPPNAAGRIRDAIAARRRRQVSAASGAVVVAVVSGALVVTQFADGQHKDAAPVVGPTTPTSTTTGSSNRHGPSYADLHEIDAYEWQTSFGGYRDQVLNLAAAHDNYTAYRLIYKSRSFLVFGSGEPAPALAQLIADGPTRAHARWISVPYSDKKLERASNLVDGALSRMVWSRVRHDYRGLMIGILAKTLSDADQARLHAVAHKLTDVDITFVASRGFDVGGSVPLPLSAH